MKKPDNNSLVIFGASGDLTHRKLIPALFHLFKNGRLADDFAILGVSRTEFTDEQYREKLSDILSRSENIEKSEMDEFFMFIIKRLIRRMLKTMPKSKCGWKSSNKHIILMAILYFIFPHHRVCIR